MNKIIANLNTSMVRGIFNGTYESMWEVSEIDDDGNELEVDYDFNEFMKAIAEVYKFEAPDIILSEWELPFVKSIEFTGGFYSPREYNFSTDSLDFKIELDKKGFMAELKKLENDSKFKEFLIDNYRSRDGFISFTPDNYSEILESITEEKSDFEQSISAVLNYLIPESESYYESLEGQIYEIWRGNGYGGLDYKIIENNE